MALRRSYAFSTPIEQLNSSADGTAVGFTRVRIRYQKFLKNSDNKSYPTIKKA